MTDYSKYSFWLETSGDDLTPRASLLGSTEVDVVVLGDGYTGLWTAYYLLKNSPGLRVAVIEKRDRRLRRFRSQRRMVFLQISRDAGHA